MDNLRNADASFFGMLGFYASGFLNLSSKETYKLCQEGAILLDVRMPYFVVFKGFGVPQVISIPLSELEQKITLLPNDIPLIVADSVGIHSHEAMLLLQTKGFQNIANLAGGMVEWERDGLPIKVDNEYQLSGSCVCQLKPRNK